MKMVKSLLASSIPLLLLANTVLALNCDTHSFTQCEDNIVHWFDPETGQICDPHDCGGGRAPPRRDVPGCPQYTGTETRATSASFLSCWTGFATPSSMVSATPSPVETTTETEIDPETATEAAPEETEEPSIPSSSIVDATPSTTQGTVEGSGSATPSPSTTTPPPNVSSGTLSASASGSDTAPPSESTPNAGQFLDRSMAAVVAGVAVGVVVLV